MLKSLLGSESRSNGSLSRLGSLPPVSRLTGSPARHLGGDLASAVPRDSPPASHATRTRTGDAATAGACGARSFLLLLKVTLAAQNR
ncbi:hypothetical protein EYF80_032971 [Liparis tanakae]|uniref:Uncharacterized protein n=1 Tax=Liparis tanakae TaxID=230148 RepID=A0A4Z2GVL4_9TELE|nr:hypothetical protein EYF80_032971 [Liparis tanakae]